LKSSDSVQLRELSQSEPDEKHPDADRWHPLAKKYHVDAIPQMFLIDRNGILRYTDADDDLGKKVTALISEKVADAPASAPAAPAAKP
jgi:molecular chaperone DnaK (HSP70)